MRILLLLAFLAFAPAAAQAQHAVGYDDFAKLERGEQVRVLGEISPDARAAIVRTHVERWLAVNRDRLNAEQIAVMEDMIAWIGPRLFEEANQAAVQAETEERIGRLLAVLPLEDVQRAFGEPGANGNYIPPPGEK